VTFRFFSVKAGIGDSNMAVEGLKLAVKACRDLATLV